MNGYSNYETWKIMLELFIDIDTSEDKPVTAEWCENVAYVLLELDSDGSVWDYNVVKNSIVRSWLASVNWQEIADAINLE